MRLGVDRILTTHAGALPRPADLYQLVTARATGQPYDEAVLAASLHRAVAEAVDQQLACGIDSINDGELGKINFTTYVRDRLGGLAVRPAEGPDSSFLKINGRELRKFPEYFAPGGAGYPRYAGTNVRFGQSVCVGPLAYVGHAALETDLANFKAAVAGKKVVDAYLPANTPGTIEHWLANEHYQGEEAFLYGIAEAMRVEYEAIVNAGFRLQIDDPDLPDGWQMFPDMSVADYRKYATLRIEALNHALRNIPRDRIRLHVCWGSFHGPHQHDIPLADIVDLIFRVKACEYSFEASNPVHDHEWRVFESSRIPDGAVLIPGVVGHFSDFIEHPELIADRLERYARLVGRENVMAGTDCGIGPRVGHARIAWAKLESLVEGARVATKRLWK